MNNNSNQRDSTARSRELGAELRKRRKAARLQGVDLARKLGWSQTKVSRMETGDRGASEVDLAIYLTFCGVYGEELAALLRLQDGPGSVIYSETTASTIHSYEPMLIPGLLQTEDYARALFKWARLVPENRVEQKVQARMERQQLLSRWSPPQLNFYVHESALLTPVGASHVMHEQMLNLLLMTSRPQVALRIVPISAGPHGALCGPFVLMQYDLHNPVLHLENLASASIVESEQDAEVYRAVLNRLAEIALDGGESRELIAHRANEYEPETGPP